MVNKTIKILSDKVDKAFDLYKEKENVFNDFKKTNSNLLKYRSKLEYITEAKNLFNNEYKKKLYENTNERRLYNVNMNTLSKHKVKIAEMKRIINERASLRDQIPDYSKNSSLQAYIKVVSELENMVCPPLCDEKFDLGSYEKTYNEFANKYNDLEKQYKELFITYSKLKNELNREKWRLEYYDYAMWNDLRNCQGDDFDIYDDEIFKVCNKHRRAVMEETWHDMDCNCGGSYDGSTEDGEQHHYDASNGRCNIGCRINVEFGYKASSQEALGEIKGVGYEDFSAYTESY